VRAAFVAFGHACADPGADVEYQAYAGIDWEDTYDAWETAYLAAMEARMRASIDARLRSAKLHIDIELSSTALDAGKRKDLERLRADIAKNDRYELSNAAVSLAKLRRVEGPGN
jgi:hypothetical protein